MKKKMIAGILFAIGIIAITNVPFVSLFFRLTIGGESLKGHKKHFSSNNPAGFSIWAQDSYGYTVQLFREYRAKHPADSLLYRNFMIKPFQFWNWYEYATYPAYRLPYRPIPEDAEENERGWRPETDTSKIRDYQNMEKL